MSVVSFLFNSAPVARRLAKLFAGLVWCASAWSSNSAQSTPLTSVSPHLLVGYFPQWGLYQDEPYTVKSLLDSGAVAMLDQLNYAQGFVTGGHCSVADPNADLNYTFTVKSSVDGSADSPNAALRGNFHQLVELKRRYPRLKILISLMGHASDFAADAQPDVREDFVASCVSLFLKGNFADGASEPGLFDGIDLDWEYPRGVDSANYAPLLAEFRRQMDALRPGLRLTVALGASPHMYGESDIASIGRTVDLAGLMTYDFNGPWSGTTGFIAPLHSSSPDEGSVETSVGAWTQAGIPADKLLIGLPFYGYGWRNVQDGNHGLSQHGRPIHGDYSYRFIQSMLDPTVHPSSSGKANPAMPLPLHDGPPDPQTSATEPLAPTVPVLYRDPMSQAPWLFDGSAFWTYEDPISIASKAEFASQSHLAGFMVWELSGDTPSATLLNAAHKALIHPAKETKPIAQRPLRPYTTP